MVDQPWGRSSAPTCVRVQGLSPLGRRNLGRRSDPWLTSTRMPSLSYKHGADFCCSVGMTDAPIAGLGHAPDTLQLKAHNPIPPSSGGSRSRPRSVSHRLPISLPHFLLPVLALEVATVCTQRCDAGLWAGTDVQVCARLQLPPGFM
eukprot:365241-Chlamydomonas_euryale.AAC.16